MIQASRVLVGRLPLFIFSKTHGPWQTVTKCPSPMVSDAMVVKVSVGIIGTPKTKRFFFQWFGPKMSTARLNIDCRGPKRSVPPGSAFQLLGLAMDPSGHSNGIAT